MEIQIKLPAVQCRESTRQEEDQPNFVADEKTIAINRFLPVTHVFHVQQSVPYVTLIQLPYV